MVAQSLRAYPELALFLTLAIGYLLGKVRIGPLRLNPIIGAILAGIAIGTMRIDVPAALSSTLFALFLFASGYRMGPQFFRGLGRTTLTYAALTVLFLVTGIVSAMVARHLLGLDLGGATGLYAGSLNSSTALGTAKSAIVNLDLSDPARASTNASLAVAFAVTYVIGFFANLWALASIAPWLMRVDVAAECRKLEAAMGIRRAEFGVVSARREWSARAYKVPEGLGIANVRDLERSFTRARVFVDRIRNGDGIADAEPTTPIHPGDVVVLSGRTQFLVGSHNPLAGHEVDDGEILDIPATAVDVVITNKRSVNRTLGELATEAEEDVSRGVSVRSIRRGGVQIPLGAGTLVERGDVITLIGPKAQVSRVGAHLGVLRWRSPATDIAILATAIAVGGLIGIPTVHLFGLSIGLSQPVGMLLGGMAAGWVNATWPVIGRAPESALSVLESIGLTGFLATVGIGAGPTFLQGLQQSGIALVLAAIVVCVLPNVVLILVGYYILKIHPGILLGVCAGAGTSSPGMSAVEKVADSRVPSLGFGVTYAIGLILVALSGTILIMTLAH